MGSLFNMNEAPAATTNPSFKVIFTKEFKDLGLKFDFRIRRKPNTSVWQPLFCTVTEKGIDWSYGWNSNNIFNYYKTADDYWVNKIEIEAGELACQIQFQYEDKTLSKIYDIGRWNNEDVLISLVNKKVKVLIIHPPSKKQYDELIYGGGHKVEYDELIPGKEYCEIRSWNRIWNDTENCRYNWKDKYEEDNKKIIERYPDFLTDKNKNNHNFLTDGKRFSKRKVKILSVKPVVEYDIDRKENIIEFGEPTAYISYDVTYLVEGQIKQSVINGYDVTYSDAFFDSDRGSYCTYFVDAYNSGTRNKSSSRELEKELKKSSKILLQNEIDAYNDKIKYFKSNPTRKSRKSVIINGNEYLLVNLKGADGDGYLIPFYYQMLPYIPKGYKLPTRQDIDILTESFYKFDPKSNVSIFKDKKTGAKLELPMVGTTNPNGSNYDVGKSIRLWIDFGKYKPLCYGITVATLYSNGQTNFWYQNHGEIECCLLLIKSNGQKK